MSSYNYFDQLVIKYKNKGAFIDTNLLLLYFVGQYSFNQINSFRRTRTYTLSDFYLLKKIFDFFSVIVTTPNILTEVSNLSNQLPNNIKMEYFEKFKETVKVLEEKYIPTKELCDLKLFSKFGVTDTAIIHSSKHEYLVFTDDLPLFGILQNLNIDVININHLRSMEWL